jgi:hypothetical protein
VKAIFHWVCAKIIGVTSSVRPKAACKHENWRR